MVTVVNRTKREPFNKGQCVEVFSIEGPTGAPQDVHEIVTECCCNTIDHSFAACLSNELGTRISNFRSIR